MFRSVIFLVVFALSLAPAFSQGDEKSLEELMAEEDRKIIAEERQEERDLNHQMTTVRKDMSLLNHRQRTMAALAVVDRQQQGYGRRKPVWPAQSYWIISEDCTDLVADTQLARFVRLTLRELRHVHGRRHKITYEQLLPALCQYWREKTPYRSNAGSVTASLAQIGRSENDWRHIFRTGVGICGDHAYLILKMVSLTINHSTCRYVLDTSLLTGPSNIYRERLKMIGIVGPANKTHAAVGLIEEAAFKKKIHKERDIGRPDGTTFIFHQADFTDLSMFDVRVYDMWVSPSILGTDLLGSWAANYNASTWRSAISRHYKVYFNFPPSIADKTWEN